MTDKKNAAEPSGASGGDVMEMIAFISDDSLRLVAEGAAYWQASATACPAGFEPRSLSGWIMPPDQPEPEPPV